MSGPEHNTRPCPDCRAGKHGLCDGTSWCQPCDKSSKCPCSHDYHQRKAS